MKSGSQLFLVTIMLAGGALAADPAHTDDARAQLQAEQAGKQAVADVLWRYLKTEPGRKRMLDAVADQLTDLVMKDDSATAATLNSVSKIIAQWTEALQPLRALELPPPALGTLKAVDGSLSETARLASDVPVAAVVVTKNSPAAADSPAGLRLQKQQAVFAAISAILALKQQVVRLDGQLDEVARRSAASAQQRASQVLMLPASDKGKKP